VYSVRFTSTLFTFVFYDVFLCLRMLVREVGFFHNIVQNIKEIIQKNRKEKVEAVIKWITQ
jgi:hypothetical protein